MLQQTPGVWYVSSSVSDSWEPNMTLTITSFTTKCFYWDIVTETWSTDGCSVSFWWTWLYILLTLHAQQCCITGGDVVSLSQVGNKSTPYLTQCLCNHLTIFGSSFFVMPNHVDISRTAELFATVTENYVVLALLCSFFGLYLITLLWACYADRRASSKVSLWSGGEFVWKLNSSYSFHWQNTAIYAHTSIVCTTLFYV